MLPLSLVPEHQRRASRGFGVQIQTAAVLDGILGPRLPQDAAALIAITSADLYPDDRRNFVFGQAPCGPHATQGRTRPAA